MTRRAEEETAQYGNMAIWGCQSGPRECNRERSEECKGEQERSPDGRRKRQKCMDTGDNQKDWGEIETRGETSCRVGQNKCERRNPEKDRQQDRRGEQNEQKPRGYTEKKKKKRSMQR